jgi:CRP/FNR family transcriptional regulator, nitrogen oxide reductase regulator
MTYSVAHLTMGMFGKREDGPAGEGLLARWIQRVGALHRAPAGTTLCAQGTMCQQIYCVEEGWLTLLRTEGTGVDVIVGLRQAGAVVAAGGALARLPHPMTVVTRTSVRLRIVPVTMLEQALRDDHAIRRALVEELARDTIAHVARCGALGCLGAREHLERLLWEFAAATSGDAARIPLSIGEVAGILGVDTSHASRLLRALKREGIVDTTRGWIIVRDAQRLARPLAS